MLSNAKGASNATDGAIQFAQAGGAGTAEIVYVPASDWLRFTNGKLNLSVVDTQATFSWILSYDNATGEVEKIAGSAFGDVVGPASATDNAVARFDGTTGKLIQNSVVTIGDTGAAMGFLSINATNATGQALDILGGNAGGPAAEIVNNSTGDALIVTASGGGLSLDATGDALFRDDVDVDGDLNTDGTFTQTDGAAVNTIAGDVTIERNDGAGGGPTLFVDDTSVSGDGSTVTPSGFEAAAGVGGTFALTGTALTGSDGVAITRSSGDLALSSEGLSISYNTAGSATFALEDVDNGETILEANAGADVDAGGNSWTFSPTVTFSSEADFAAGIEVETIQNLGGNGAMTIAAGASPLVTVTNDLTVGDDATVTDALTVNGNTALGNAASDTTTIAGIQINTPANVVGLLAGFTLTPTTSVLTHSGSTSRTSDGTTAISDGVDGQIFEFINYGTGVITFTDGANIQCPGGANLAVGQYDSMTCRWVSSASFWIVTASSNN